MNIQNIFSDIPESLPEELFDEILTGGSFRLERIVSRAHATPPGQWYDQERPEWVVLLTGGAGLRFEGRDELVELTPGDSLHIPAHKRHRVEWTDPEQDTVWLALHYSKPE
ncbi:MAG: cupin domain-containing protein [Phycisphaerae bacterium]|nr:cupin domain-containing protein [Phycisphaerae bacterium]